MNKNHSTDEEIDAHRTAALAERSDEDLPTKYAPGTFGCHEALHATLIVSELLQSAILDHGAIIANPEWYRLASRAADELAALYQAIGAAHLSVESEAENG